MTSIPLQTLSSVLVFKLFQEDEDLLPRLVKFYTIAFQRFQESVCE